MKIPIKRQKTRNVQGTCQFCSKNGKRIYLNLSRRVFGIDFKYCPECGFIPEYWMQEEFERNKLLLRCEESRKMQFKTVR